MDVVVIVVVGQIVGFISSKMLAYDCLCTLEVCRTSKPFLPTFGGFSAQCLSKLFLKELTVLLLTTSLGRAFPVEVILIG